jgi:hypothetical protein
MLQRTHQALCLDIKTVADVIGLQTSVIYHFGSSVQIDKVSAHFNQIELPPNAKRAKDDADWKLATQSSGGALSGRSPSPHVSDKDALFAPPSVGGGVQGGPDKDFD